MYAIAGVTGHTGKAVAETLHAKGQPIRVVVRDETKGASWKSRGAEVAVASVDDESALTGALRGVSGAYVLLPPDAETGAGGDPPLPVLREAHLTEDEVQALLRFALVDGRLGTARDDYPGNMDAPSTVFELHADGVDRRIVVGGLTDDPAPGPDAEGS